MNTQHTPGPWTVSCMRLTTAPALGRDTRLLEVGPPEERLALVYFDMKTGLGQADARLIAAAPELLEVAYLLLEMVNAPNPMGQVEIKHQAIALAKSAILKAQGG